MQAVAPVDVHVENEWHDGSDIKKDIKTSIRKDPQAARMRTRVLNQTKTRKTGVSLSPSSRIPKQVVVPKLVLPARSKSSSPNRGPW